MQSQSITKNNDGILPNLIIIGAAKCGTTSLYYYLSLHPEISMSREKELHFFVYEQNWHKALSVINPTSGATQGFMLSALADT